MTRLGRAGAAGSISQWLRSRSLGKLGQQLTTAMVSTGALLALLAVIAVYVSLFSAPGTIGFLAAGFALVMLAIAVIDWRSFIIPNGLNAAGGGLAILRAAAQEPEAMLQAVAMATLRGVALALIFLALRWG